MFYVVNSFNLEDLGDQKKIIQFSHLLLSDNGGKYNNVGVRCGRVYCVYEGL